MTASLPVGNSTEAYGHYSTRQPSIAGGICASLTPTPLDSPSLSSLSLNGTKYSCKLYIVVLFGPRRGPGRGRPTSLTRFLSDIPPGARAVPRMRNPPPRSWLWAAWPQATTNRRDPNAAPSQRPEREAARILYMEILETFGPPLTWTVSEGNTKRGIEEDMGFPNEVCDSDAG